MSNPQKRKGDKAEREAAELLTEVTGFECQRNLSAGIQEMLEIFMAYQIVLYRYAIGRTNQKPVLLNLEKLKHREKMQE